MGRPGRVAALLAIFVLGSCELGDRVESTRRSGPERSPRAERRYAEARTTGRLKDDAITEASGIAASRLEPGSYWVHNDSGGSPQLFCVKPSGRSCGTTDVTGAGLLDWEDIAAGPNGELLIGDIGDNSQVRSEIVIYRIAEPASDPAGGLTQSEPADAITLRYPDGAFDAETLMVHPDSGALYVVTKDTPALVLRAPPDGGRLRVVGALRLPGLITLPTGGDIAPDGDHVILTTYDQAYEFSRPPGRPFDSVWKTRPRAVSLPLARQREAIAYRSDGRGIISTSEGVQAPIVERRLDSG